MSHFWVEAVLPPSAAGLARLQMTHVLSAWVSERHSPVGK